MQTRNRPTIKLRGGPHGIPRPVVQQVQRQRLHAAVLEATAAEGYRATTVRKVIARAGISRRTFYELYRDLDDCYLAAYVEATEDAERNAAAACAVEGSPAQRLEAGLAAVLELCASEPQVAKACIVEVLAAGPAARERRAALHERLAESVAGLLGPAGDADRPATVAAPPARDDPAGHGRRHARLRARVLVGGVNELVYDRLLRDDPESLRGIADQIVASQLALSEEAAGGG